MHSGWCPTVLTSWWYGTGTDSDKRQKQENFIVLDIRAPSAIVSRDAAHPKVLDAFRFRGASEAKKARVRDRQNANADMADPGGLFIYSATAFLERVFVPAYYGCVGSVSTMVRASFKVRGQRFVSRGDQCEHITHFHAKYQTAVHPEATADAGNAGGDVVPNMRMPEAIFKRICTLRLCHLAATCLSDQREG
jgi:hypothetical protein